MGNYIYNQTPLVTNDTPKVNDPPIIIEQPNNNKTDVKIPVVDQLMIELKEVLKKREEKKNQSQMDDLQIISSDEVKDIPQNNSNEEKNINYTTLLEIEKMKKEIDNEKTELRTLREQLENDRIELEKLKNTISIANNFTTFKINDLTKNENEQKQIKKIEKENSDIELLSSVQNITKECADEQKQIERVNSIELLSSVQNLTKEYVDDENDQKILNDYIIDSINSKQSNHCICIYGKGANGKSTYIRKLYEKCNLHMVYGYPHGNEGVKVLDKIKDNLVILPVDNEITEINMLEKIFKSEHEHFTNIIFITNSITYLLDVPKDIIKFVEFKKIF